MSNTSRKRGRRAMFMVVMWACMLAAVIVVSTVVVAARHHHPRSVAATASTSATTATSSATPGLSDQQKEDAIANAPMLLAPEKSQLPTIEVAATTPPLNVPAPTGRVVQGVPVYPHTPEGAVGQLAALDAAGTKNLDVDLGRQIHDAWTMPGGVSVSQWSPTMNTMSYWQQHPDQNPAQVTATVTPIQGLIKGSVGSDWVLACFAGRFQGSYSGTLGGSLQQGVEECARMQWSDNRWMLGPGTPAAPPPLVWPRSQLAYQAGFRDLVKDN